MNDVVPEYLSSAKYEPGPSTATISNAMDVGAPSNFARMKEIFGNDWKSMTESISGFAYDDTHTREAIKKVYQRYGYVIDPHGAVGYLAAEKWLENHPDDSTVILETAHPAKFPEIIIQELGEKVLETPERLACLADKPKTSILMEAKNRALVAWLNSNLA